MNAKLREESQSGPFQSGKVLLSWTFKEEEERGMSGRDSAKRTVWCSQRECVGHLRTVRRRRRTKGHADRGDLTRNKGREVRGSKAVGKALKIITGGNVSPCLKECQAATH